MRGLLLNNYYSLQVDEASKWSKLEITFPVQRKTVIRSKYLSFITLIVTGAVFSGVTTLISFLRDNAAFRSLDLSPGYTLGFSLSVSTIAIVYPAVLKFGVEKSEMMIFVAAGSSIVIRIVVWALLGMFRENVNFNSSEVGIASLAVAVVMFAGSYLLSVRIHKNKQF
ncbi:ABC-2 transporter permease [Paenibacillus sp. MMS20-IR301]|uniref:ABC-2 transporter permease n=1 Tax=Paenibacillus sp. MMS20-IR301 TaxID=2895946 RepID=UPI0028E20E55|nr:ABC-2 transporter permease [Paenibacillus sp. MMS20-IR301]WNS45584.1 ABC-2 transporter permease [Paenibacillus sp. MMS20-IR301]